MMEFISIQVSASSDRIVSVLIIYHIYHIRYDRYTTINVYFSHMKMKSRVTRALIYHNTMNNIYFHAKQIFYSNQFRFAESKFLQRVSTFHVETLYSMFCFTGENNNVLCIINQKFFSFIHFIIFFSLVLNFK